MDEKIHSLLVDGPKKRGEVIDCEKQGDGQS